MHHIFILHSQVNEHITDIQFLAILNRAAIDTGKQVSISVVRQSLSVCPIVVYVDSEADLFPDFGETATLISIVALFKEFLYFDHLLTLVAYG